MVLGRWEANSWQYATNVGCMRVGLVPSRVPRRGKKKGLFSGWSLKRVRIGVRGFLPEIAAELERAPPKKRRAPSKRRVQSEIIRLTPSPSGGGSTVVDQVLDAVQREGIRTFKRSVKEGDYVTAAVSAYVSWLAENERKKRGSA